MHGRVLPQRAATAVRTRCTPYARDMEQAVFEIDGTAFEDFDGFIREFDRGFVSRVGGNWTGNLDAFNDYLSWADTPCAIRWRQSNKSRDSLGHAAMAEWLTGNLTRCHPANVESVQERLDNARNGNGPTLFDWLVEIIHDNEDYVELILE